MKNLNQLTVKELSVIATELGLTLSYKSQDGKRKRFTKDELISNIEYREHELNHEKIESNNSIENIDKCSMYPSLLKNDIKIKNDSHYGERKIIDEKINLNLVVKEVKQLLSTGEVQKVKNIISQLQEMISNERKNKLLIRNMSNKLNIVKSLFKSHSKKYNLI